MIPLTAVEVDERDVEAVAARLRSGWLTMGPVTQRFEGEFAAATGAAHAVAVGSGTAALHLALIAAGAGPGGEVLLPGLGFPGLPALVERLGARPVWCDVRGPGDHAIDPDAVRERARAATRAIVADHRWGRPCDLAALRATADEHGAVLIEDAAHAVLAAGVGAGHLACFSLSSTKQLVAGEGGVLTTDDPALEARVRPLRSHAMTSVTWDRHRGHATTYDVTDLGFNFRIDEPRAALASSRLPRLGDEIGRRRAVVRAYREGLDALPGVVAWSGGTDDDRSSHGAFGVLLEDRPARDRAAAGLTAAGVASETPTWSGRDRPDADALLASLPRTREVVERGLRLPLHGAMDPGEAASVCAALRDATA